MDDICIVGPVSKDAIYHGNRRVMESIGGVPIYAGLAASQLGASLQIITKWATADCHHFEALATNSAIRLKNVGTAQTTSFDLVYASALESDRAIRLTAASDPFGPDDLQHADAKLIYLAPLMNSDLGLDLIKTASKQSTIALDVQGLLRRQIDGRVQITDWAEKLDALPHIQILKASHAEAAYLTGTDDPVRAAQQITAWGAQEVIVTRDRWGAHIVQDGVDVDIHAFEPPTHVDTTGCGDTFFAAYLCQRLRGVDIEPSGQFAAAAAALKIGRWGPSQANTDEILAFMHSAPRLQH